MKNTQILSALRHIISAPPDTRHDFLALVSWIMNQGDQQNEENHHTLQAIANSLRLSLQDIQKAQLRAAQAISPAELVQKLHQSFDEMTLLSMLMGIALGDGDYSAAQRSALRRFAHSISLTDDDLAEVEEQAFLFLQNPMSIASLLNDDASSPQASKPKQNTRPWLIALGVIAGAVLLGTAGFFAAPAIGGIIGSTALGLSGAAATSAGTALLGGGSLASGGFGMAGGTAVVTSIMGATGATIAGIKTAHRTADLAEFNLEELQSGGSRVIIGVSGFLSQKEDFHDHWQALKQFYPNQTIHALRWESKCLLDLGKTLAPFGATLPAGKAAATLAARASKAAAGAAALPIWALSALNIIDNPWSVARDRAEKAGRELANTLRQRPWGARPVTLVGFSLGARVIVHALAELSAAEISNRVESVFLLGGAVGAKRPEIDHIRHAVTGPVVNGYCPTDAILNWLYRSAEWESPIGLGPLDRAGILDVDLSSVVNGHTKYNQKLPQILAKVTAQANAQDPHFWVQ